MTNNIVKRNTFKEAFSDVLKMSHEELISHSIDPFIEDAFNAFEQMDFSYKNIIYKSNYNLSNDFFIVKNYLIAESFGDDSHSYFKICNFNAHHESAKACIEESNEVPQWLLAA